MQSQTPTDLYKTPLYRTIRPLYNLSLFSLYTIITAFISLFLELGINALHIKLRATGGNKTKTPGPGAQSALRALARSRMKIGRIGFV
ncbi:hypothetical protein ACSBR2_036180 [Camellia fascicularis]